MEERYSRVLDYQIPVTQPSQGPKGNGDLLAEKRVADSAQEGDGDMKDWERNGDMHAAIKRNGDMQAAGKWRYASSKTGRWRYTSSNARLKSATYSRL